MNTGGQDLAGRRTGEDHYGAGVTSHRLDGMSGAGAWNYGPFGQYCLQTWSAGQLAT